MIEQDIFVGVVALLTGLFVIGSAVLNSKWISRYWIARRLSENSDSSVSRVVVFGIGLLCALLGVLLLLGFFSSSSERSKGPNSKRNDSTSQPAGRLAKLATGN